MGSIRSDTSAWLGLEINERRPVGADARRRPLTFFGEDACRCPPICSGEYVSCPACREDAIPYDPISEAHWCPDCQSVFYRSPAPWWKNSSSLPLGGFYRVRLAKGMSNQFRKKPPFDWRPGNDSELEESVMGVLERTLELANLDQLFVLMGGNHAPAVFPHQLAINFRRGLERYTWVLLLDAVPQGESTQCYFHINVRDMTWRR